VAFYAKIFSNDKGRPAVSMWQLTVRQLLHSSRSVADSNKATMEAFERVQPPHLSPDHYCTYFDATGTERVVLGWPKCIDFNVKFRMAMSQKMGMGKGKKVSREATPLNPNSETTGFACGLRYLTTINTSCNACTVFFLHSVVSAVLPAVSVCDITAVLK